jgi:hypothetical protein
MALVTMSQMLHRVFAGSVGHGLVKREDFSTRVPSSSYGGEHQHWKIGFDSGGVSRPLNLECRVPAVRKNGGKFS